MKNIFLWILIAPFVASITVVAQGRGTPPPMPASERIPSSLMTFFVTSEPIGDGGNLGGLAGADAHCQALATAAGAVGKTWRAYLSTQARPGQPAVNARDRIGTGPWYHPKERLLDYLQRRLSRPIIQSEIHGTPWLKRNAAAISRRSSPSPRRVSSSMALATPCRRVTTC